MDTLNRCHICIHCIGEGIKSYRVLKSGALVVDMINAEDHPDEESDCVIVLEIFYIISFIFNLETL